MKKMFCDECGKEISSTGVFLLLDKHDTEYQYSIYVSVYREHSGTGYDQSEICEECARKLVRMVKETGK